MMMPLTQHSPTRGCQMEEVLASIGSDMAAATDWSEVMSLEVEMAQQERIVKGDNEWSEDNMKDKSDRAGCRVTTTNAPKRVLTQNLIDTETLEEGKVEARNYIDYLIAYMQEMNGDIMVIHQDPGLRRGVGSTGKTSLFF